MPFETTGARASAMPTTSAPALSWQDGALVRHGREHRMLSGALHYFRIHPDQWEDRLRRLAAMGANTVDTYVAWNFHERTEGDIRFDGWRNLGAFLRLCTEVGLDVFLRPSPYICAEWSNGGLPHWLTARVAALRTSDAAYMAAVERWYDELIPRIAPYQAAHGGPIVAVQVENEYGSYGSDRAYARFSDGALPPVPPPPTYLAPRTVELVPMASVYDVIQSYEVIADTPIPQTFEQLGVEDGLVAYTAVSLVPEVDVLAIDGLHDRATVFIDGIRVAILDRDGTTTVTLAGSDRPVEITVLVESLGRINYGPRLGEHKGILGGVRVGRRLVHGWLHRALPLDERPLLAAPAPPGADGLAVAAVNVAAPADAWLAFPDSAKGMVWLNGFLLGRYWAAGPVRTMYAPAPLWRAGANEICVLDTDALGTTLEIRDRPDSALARSSSAPARPCCDKPRTRASRRAARTVKHPQPAITVAGMAAPILSAATPVVAARPVCGTQAQRTTARISSPPINFHRSAGTCSEFQMARVEHTNPAHAEQRALP